jgi:hypothetical protein
MQPDLTPRFHGFDMFSARFGAKKQRKCMLMLKSMPAASGHQKNHQR